MKTNIRAIYLANLKKQIRETRCGPMCEYCAAAPHDVLFHRHWRTFQHEWQDDVMLICFNCRATIMKSPAAKTPTLVPGSLFHQGDLGLDNTTRWQAYLASPERRKALQERFLASLSEHDRGALLMKEALT